MVDIFNYVISSRVFKIACVVILSYLLYKYAVKIFDRISKKKSVSSRKQKTLFDLIKNICKYIIIVIDILIILEIFGINTTSIIAGLSVVSVVIGLAFQDVIKDFLSGISILFEDQFAIGDVIEVNSFKGEVVFLGLKTTKIKAYTGELKIISNRNITEVINYSLNESLAIVDVSVAYESDINKVEKILDKLAKRLSESLEYITGKVSVLGIQELADSAVKFRITVSTESLKHYEVQRNILKEVKSELDKNNIKIPYSQIEVHNG